MDENEKLKRTLGVMLLTAVEAARTMLRELISERGEGQWIEDYKARLMKNAKEMEMEGIAMDQERVFYEAAFATVDMIFSPGLKPRVGEDDSR